MMTVIKGRGVEEVVHYTTSDGLVGILHLKRVLSRPKLPKEKSLEFILTFNTPTVRDRGWENYVNLSITDINTKLFGHSFKKWHKDAKWRILAFDPIVMTHDGVVFTTTNNAYYSAVVRCPGREGLEKVFAEEVKDYEGGVITKKRSNKRPARNTTSEEAEVLYPHELSTEFLKRVYVMTGEEQDEVYAQIHAVDHPPVEVIVSPEKFEGYKE